MNAIISNWNFFRFVRLGLGVFILIQGIMASDKFSIVLGSLFTLMPILNIGCCGSGGCAISIKSKNELENQPTEIDYEEVGNKK